MEMHRRQETFIESTSASDIIISTKELTNDDVR